jgi:hypothetical protein
MEERRRSSRHALDTELANVPAALTVRVLDISVAGVLLQSTYRPQAGARGRLRLDLSGSPFSADVQVLRVVRAPDSATGYRVGAAFVDLPSDLRHLIERFMTQ